MSCESAQTIVHGYFDGELDAVRAAEFERHLQNCADCQASLDRLEFCRARLRENDLYEHASPYLRQQVRKQLGLEAAPARSRTSARRWLLAPAFALLATAAALTIVLFLLRPQPDRSRLTAELIDAHVRSLQPGHLTDVQSTDQHTVKPWFDGKLDFIPPVGDYSQQGFPLVGGRLDVVDGRSVAALVYGRRKHFINLFVWPARGGRALAGGSGSHAGYNWLAWRSGDMQLCLVSDTSPSDLGQLKALIHP